MEPLSIVIKSNEILEIKNLPDGQPAVSYRYLTPDTNSEVDILFSEEALETMLKRLRAFKVWSETDQHHLCGRG
jgi:hypothetical protein